MKYPTTIRYSISQSRLRYCLRFNKYNCKDFSMQEKLIRNKLQQLGWEKNETVEKQFSTRRVTLTNKEKTQ